MRKLFFIIGALLALAALFVCAVGCGQESEPPEETVVEVEENGVESPADPARTVTMNGRSVMGGWMEHWGYDWEGPAEEGGYFFDYKELDGSDLDNMASSFAANVEGLAPGAATFFKFCFVDFQGDNIRRLESIVDSVVGTAGENSLRLVIGNALPVRRQDGSTELAAEYRAYNAYLDGIAADNENVWIYDFYGVLAGTDGFLKPEYDTGDSHLNENAYDALDVTFFPLLEEVLQQ